MRCSVYCSTWQCQTTDSYIRRPLTVKPVRNSLVMRSQQRVVRPAIFHLLLMGVDIVQFYDVQDEKRFRHHSHVTATVVTNCKD